MELLRVGYFGSYARDEWAVGSDLDVLIVLDSSGTPFVERGRDWDLTRLPVPAEALVYTDQELEELTARGGRFGTVLRDETVWVYSRK